MRLRGRTIAWSLAAIAVFATGVLGYRLLDVGSDDGSEARDAVRPGGGDARVNVEATPSDLARESVEPKLLRLYRETGGRIGIDWAVIAATDQLEGMAGATVAEERVLAIAYSLQGFGAPDDYRQALETRGSTPRFAGSVLDLAERYRQFGSDRLPAARGRLELPVDGPIIAAFGERFGALHDGIDIDAPSGAQIRAAATGLVVRTGFHPIFGEYTCIVHRFDPPLEGRERVTTCYGNQSRYAVETGDVVRRGELIGYVGCTGSCLRPHTHFQLRDGAGGAAPVIDPAPFLEGDAGPVGSKPPLEAAE